MDNLTLLIIYIVLFLLIRQVYKRHIEKIYDYKIPTKKGFGVDRNLVHYDEQVINNKKLASKINTLFIAENIGVLIMVIGVIYSILN